LKGTEVKECTLHYPRHELSPEDFLHFVELDEFRGDWEDLGLDVEEDLWTLQILIMTDPAGPRIEPGTGGLRKMRFAPKQWRTGKRGAARVCYVYFPTYWTVLLVAAYRKSKKDKLTDEEKKGIRMYIEQVEEWLARHNY